VVLEIEKIEQAPELMRNLGLLSDASTKSHKS